METVLTMTSYYIPNSQEAHSSKLGLFFLPPTDLGIESYHYLDFRPSAKANEGDCIEFNIDNQTASYIDLSKCRLHVKCQILLGNGDVLPGITNVADPDTGKPTPSIPDKARVAICNLFYGAMFRQVEVMLQQKVISPHVGTNYAYKAYFDTMFYSSETAQLTEATNMLYEKEYYEFMGDVDPFSSGNTSVRKRYRYIEESNIFDMEGKIFSDVFQVDRLLLNNVSVRVRFSKNEPSFSLVSANTNPSYKINIVDAYMRVALAKPTAPVLISQSNVLKNTPALYPYTGSVIKSFSLAQRERQVSLSNIFNGDIPSQLIVAMLDTNAYIGSYDKNPFQFKPFSCNYVSLKIDGNNTPFSPMTPQFVHEKEEKNTVAAMYSNLFLGSVYPFITRSEFTDGFTVFYYEISKMRKGSLAPQKRGLLELDLRFGRELPNPITILVYGRFPAMFKIDETRNILLG